MSQSFFVLPDDPIKFIFSADTDTHILSNKMTNFMKWKSETRKYKDIQFIKPIGSTMIAAISGARIMGIYDYVTKSGYLFKDVISQVLSDSSLSYINICSNDLYLDNESIFHPEDNPKFARIRSLSIKLLSDLTTSSEYKSYTADEISVKAIRLAMSHEENMTSISNILNQ